MGDKVGNVDMRDSIRDGDANMGDMVGVVGVDIEEVRVIKATVTRALDTTVGVG